MRDMTIINRNIHKYGYGLLINTCTLIMKCGLSLSNFTVFTLPLILLTSIIFLSGEMDIWKIIIIKKF
jgi:hypothetical protein